MSGYFDALLRSGGMAATPPIQPAPPAPAPGLEAIGEAPAMPAAGSAPVPSSVAAALPEAVLPAAQRPAPPVELPLPVQLVPDPALTPASNTAPHPGPAPARPSTSRVTEYPPAASQPDSTHGQTSEPPAARPAFAADPGRALVRAALDWVAAGPPGTVPVEPAAATQGAAQPRPAPDAPVPAGPHRNEAMPVAARVPLDARQDALRDETVEISIGTIQVRVDAPAVQAPAVPPAPTPPAGIAHSTRGALARRSLRRF